MFDITIVSQSFLYRKQMDKEKSIWRNPHIGRGTSAEEEGLLSADATGAGEGASPQYRRRTLTNIDDNA